MKVVSTRRSCVGALRVGSHEAQRRKYTTVRVGVEAEADWVHYFPVTGRDTCSYQGRGTP